MRWSPSFIYSICKKNAIKLPAPGGKKSQQNESSRNQRSNQPQIKLETGCTANTN